MEILAVTPPKLIEHYEFTLFGRETPLIVSIDSAAGDDLTISDVMYLFKKAARSSITDSDVKLPAEVITVFKQHVLHFTVKTYEVQQLSPEQQAQLTQYIKSLAPKK